MKFSSLLFLILIIFSGASIAQHGRAYKQHRAQLLLQLKRCGPSGHKPGCDEMMFFDVLWDVIKLYKKGDHAVLQNLMDVAPNSDGAFSEALGGVFSDLLCDHPRAFLIAVSKRPRREHENLLDLAATDDGSGMDCKHIGSLRRTLLAIKRNRNDKLHQLAGECMKAVNKYNPVVAPR